jgi:hypothetical protein
MTKADKHMGVVPPKYRSSSDRPTPKAVPKKTLNKYGYKSTYMFGRYLSSYTRWYETEAQRDQALEAANKQNFLRKYQHNIEKIER